MTDQKTQEGEVIKAVKPIVLTLPALSVQVTGAIQIASDFDLFEAALRDFIDNQLIKKPATDEDFANLDAQIKTLEKAEAKLNEVEADWLAQIAPIDAAKRTKDMLLKLARDNRLLAQRLLTQEKEARRLAIIKKGRDAFELHVWETNKILGGNYIAAHMIDENFAGAIKGKSVLASMQKAIDAELARLIGLVNNFATRVTSNRQSLRQDMPDVDWITLFPDFQIVGLKSEDDFKNLFDARLLKHTAQAEADRKRVIAEEDARREREAKAQQDAKDKAARDAEAERQAAIEVERQLAGLDAPAETEQAASVEVPPPVAEATPLYKPLADAKQAPDPLIDAFNNWYLRVNDFPDQYSRAKAACKFGFNFRVNQQFQD